MVTASSYGADPGAVESASENSYRFFIVESPLVWLLLLLSIVTMSLVVQYCLAIRHSRLIPAEVIEQAGNFLATSQITKATEYLDQQESSLARVLYVGLSEVHNGHDAMDTAMAEMLEQDTTTLLRKIEWLNIIGNVAPMIGLFGTVWGMIDSFNSIVQAGGQPEMVELADGISTALVTTWWGMVVAIPALAAYGFFRNRIDALSAETAITAEEILIAVPLK